MVQINKFAGFTVIALCAIAASAAPLLTYSLSLALFGLPHVLTEFRYVDEQFAGRLTPRIGTALLGLLGLIVFLRLMSLTEYGFSHAPRLELGLVLTLAALTLPVIKRSNKSLALGLILFAAIAYGVVLAPLATLVLLAVAHNLTPVGFLLDQCAREDRVKLSALCVLVFGVVPILIATGIPAKVLAAIHLDFSQASILSTGGLSANLGVFVPWSWRGSNVAIHLFAAAAYLQCLHYAVVLHVLPRLSAKKAESRIAWPNRRRFSQLVFGAGLVFFAGFTLSFGETRSVYGIFAAIHAWVEVPILLLALELRPNQIEHLAKESSHAA